MRNAARLLGLATLVAASISCGNVVRQGSSPVYLVIDSLQGIRGAATPGSPAASLTSDVLTIVTTGGTCSLTSPCPTVFTDSGQVALRTVLKNIGTGVPLNPTSNNEVTISRYHVEYIRADGRNTPGVDVPYAFDGASMITIPPGGQPGSSVPLGFTLVRAVAKQEPPLVQLISSPNVLNMIGRVTFYGQDRTGNAVSVTGEILIAFGNFGDF